MARKKRYQVQQKFWLNLNNSEQAELLDYCDHLRRKDTKYNFAGTIRDGLRLIRSLRDGKLDVLLELFPMIAAQLLEYMKQVKLETMDSEEVKAFEGIIQVNHKLDELNEMVRRLEGQSATRGLQAVVDNTPKQLNVAQIAAPNFDGEDDEDLGLTVQKDEESGARTSKNFLDSLKRLQQ